MRELENVISRSVLRASARARAGEHVLVRRDDLGPEVAGGAPAGVVTEPAPRPAPPPTSRSLRDSVEEYERALIRAAVERAEGNWAAAARELGMHRSNLHHKARRLGLLVGRS